MTNRRLSVVLLAAIAAACALSLSALGYEYVYDDKTFVAANPRIREWAGLGRAFVEHAWAFDPTKTEGSYYRPLLVVWLSLGHHLFGGAAGHHAMSIALHAGAIALVHRLGRALGLHERASIAAALVFALHPLQIQAVTWVSAANDPLMTALLLGSLVCLVERRRVWAVALFVGATLAVERALPLVLLPGWLALTMSEGPSRVRARSAVRELAPFAAALAVLLVVRAIVLRGAHRPPLRLAASLATLPDVALRYGKNLLWPAKLSLAYPEVLRGEGAALGLVVLAVLLAVAVAIGRTRKPRAFLVGALALALAAPLQVALLPGYALVQDRYLYLPLAFAALLGGDLLFPPEHERALLRASLLSAWVAALVALHPGNHAIWRNELALYRRAVEVAPDNALFLMNYANAVKRSGVDDDCALLLRARDALLRAPSTGDPPLVHYNYGNCLREHRRLGEAVAAYDAALATARGYFAAAAVNRAVALLDSGALDAAARAAADITVRSPESVAGWRIAGVIAARRRDYAEAVSAFEHALALAPNDRSLAMLLEKARADRDAR